MRCLCLDSLDIDATGGGVHERFHANGREGRVICKAEVGHFPGAAFGEAWEEFLLIEPFPVANLVGVLAGSVLPADFLQRGDTAGNRAEQLPVRILYPAVGKIVFLNFHRLEAGADMGGEFQPQPMSG